MNWFENTLGITSSASNDPGFQVNEEVQYYSVSVQQWIPARVLRYDSVTKTYNLDCKPEVTPDRIRRPPPASPSSPSGGFVQIFAAGSDVQYYSASVQTWIPAVVKSWDAQQNLYDLNVKPQVAPDRIRWSVEEGVKGRNHPSQESETTARTNFDLAREDRKEPARVSFSGLPAISESGGGSPQMTNKDFSEQLRAIQLEHEKKYRELESQFRITAQENEELEYRLKIAGQERDRSVELESKLEEMVRRNEEGNHALVETEQRYDESERRCLTVQRELAEVKRTLERTEQDLRSSQNSKNMVDPVELERVKARCQQLVESKRDMEEDLLEKESQLESALIKLQLKNKEVKALYEGFQLLKEEERSITEKLTQRVEENRKYIMA